MNDARLNADTLARSSNALGSAYLQKNQTEKAIQYFNKALELQPNFAEAAENLRKARGEK
jgi:tetratricopeptide (TPR) repeat protein